MPTYDERENVEPLVRALGDVLDVSRDRVLVIDDGSPDGTGEIADRLAEELPWLEVLHRMRKEGIGRAYLAGFARVLETTDAQLVLEMDCDFSHDPADVRGSSHRARTAPISCSGRAGWTAAARRTGGCCDA